MSLCPHHYTGSPIWLLKIVSLDFLFELLGISAKVFAMTPQSLHHPVLWNFLNIPTHIPLTAVYYHSLFWLSVTLCLSPHTWFYPYCFPLPVSHPGLSLLQSPMAILFLWHGIKISSLSYSFLFNLESVSSIMSILYFWGNTHLSICTSFACCFWFGISHPGWYLIVLYICLKNWRCFDFESQKAFHFVIVPYFTYT